MLLKRRHEIVLDEKDVTRAIQAIGKSIGIRNEVAIGNCCWANEPSKWFIHFTLSNKDWKSAVLKLQEIESVKIIK